MANSHQIEKQEDSRRGLTAAEASTTFAGLVALIHKDQLARMQGYASANNAFQAWLIKMGIHPVPGRSGWYDPHHVRRRLNIMQDMIGGDEADREEQKVHSLVGQRRARRGKA